MVTNLIVLFLLLPSLFFAGEFTATISQNPVHIGESFILNLTLKGASARGTPWIEELKKSFVIHSQQQMYNTVILNGQVNSNITWKIKLAAQKEGTIFIPAISTETTEGILVSEPIKLTVLPSKTSSEEDGNPVNLTLDLSNAKPYKNESFVYTLRLISKHELANIKMQKLEVEDAIIEAYGDPKLYRKRIDGANVNVIEVSYLITPLKAGPLKVPSTIIQGGIPARRKAHSGSLFDDSFDAFSMMQVFDLQPFSLASEEAIIDVQPAVSGLIPWLPAKSISIEEIWNDSQQLQVGEPFTRGFKVIAKGIKSSQLPNLQELQPINNIFRIYADQPQLAEEFNEGDLKSMRTEQFTLIPQQPGTYILPEMTVAWWDVVNKQKMLARVPSRTLHVLPAPAKNQKAEFEETTTTSEVPQSITHQRDPLLSVLIGGLGLLCLTVFGWACLLQKKIRRLQTRAKPSKQTKYQSIQTQKKTSTKKKESLPDLNPT